MRVPDGESKREPLHTDICRENAGCHTEMLQPPVPNRGRCRTRNEKCTNFFCQGNFWHQFSKWLSLPPSGREKTNITKPNFYSLFFTLTTLDPSAERLMLYYVIYGFNDSLTGWEMLGCSSEMAIVASIVYTQLLSPVLITVARPFKLKWNKTNRTKWTIFTCNLMLAKLSAWWRKSVNLTDSFYYSLIVWPTDHTCRFYVCCTNTKYIFSFPIFYLVSQTADCVYTILLNLCGKNHNTRHISSPDMSDMLLSRISEFFSANNHKSVNVEE